MKPRCPDLPLSASTAPAGASGEGDWAPRAAEGVGAVSVSMPALPGDRARLLAACVALVRSVDGAAVGRHF